MVFRIIKRYTKWNRKAGEPHLSHKNAPTAAATTSTPTKTPRAIPSVECVGVGVGVVLSLADTVVLLTGQSTIIIISCNQRLLLNKYEGLLVSPTDFQNWHKILFNHNNIIINKNQIFAKKLFKFI